MWKPPWSLQYDPNESYVIEGVKSSHYIDCSQITYFQKKKSQNCCHVGPAILVVTRPQDDLLWDSISKEIFEHN